MKMKRIKEMRKKFFLLLMLVGLIVSLIGVFGVGAEEKLAKEQVLQIAFNVGDCASLDPHYATTTVDRATVDMVFNGLVRYPPGNQVNIEPDLATSWEVSKDGKIWTFHLKKGVFFHPFPGYPSGYELTSNDVVYSLKRAADPAHSAYAGGYTGISFEDVDPYTVKIIIEKPISETLFLAKFASYAGGFIICRKAIEEKGDEWIKTHPVGTGPFMFKSYEPMEKVVLVQNKNYFRGTPILKQVIIRYMPSINSREFALQTGEVQIIEGLRQEKWLEKILTLPDVVAKPFGPCEQKIIHFSMNKAPFDDIRVRKAFSYAISRKEIAAFMGESFAVPIYSAAQAPPAPGALTKEEASEAGVIYEDNIEKAKELLAEAGYPKGFKTEAFISESSSMQMPMVAVQAQLKKVGIDMTLKVVDHATYHSLIREDASPLVLYGCWRPSVDVFLTQFYHSDSDVVTGKKPITNFSHYGTVDADGDGKIDSIDELIETAKWELNSEKQIALWKAAQIKLLKDVAIVPLFRLKYVSPMKSYVDLGHPLEFSWATYSPQVTEKTRILAH